MTNFQFSNFQTIKETLPGVEENVCLAEHTTFKIGGPAKWFFVAKTKDELIKAVQIAKQCQIPVFVLGGGSNLLISDQGFDGLVIKIQCLGVQNQVLHTAGQFNFGAGMSLAKLVELSCQNSLTGLEWAAGVPGTLGGAIYGNCAAFGAAIGDIVSQVQAYNKNTGEIKIFSKNECEFGIKTSLFKQQKDLIILFAELNLKQGNQAEIQQQARDYVKYREEHHPLKFPSAGCMFKNFTPHQRAGGGPAGLPDELRNREAISAGQLIDQAGLKGKTIGKAQISQLHANFAINLGGAKAEDVKALIDLAKQKVKENFNINLEEEVILLGF